MFSADDFQIAEYTNHRPVAARSTARAARLRGYFMWFFEPIDTR